MTMYRAFVPAKKKDDMDELPAWFVSFDGERFIEVRKKPTLAQQSLMLTMWTVICDGPSRKKVRALVSLPLETIPRKLLEGLATFEVVGERSDEFDEPDYAHPLIDSRVKP